MYTSVHNPWICVSVRVETYFAWSIADVIAILYVHKNRHSLTAKWNEWMDKCIYIQMNIFIFRILQNIPYHGKHYIMLIRILAVEVIRSICSISQNSIIQHHPSSGKYKKIFITVKFEVIKLSV